MSKSVSLILPYYNRKNYLQVTLDSFEYLYADRDDFQIVIVDDKSDEQHRVENFVTKYNELNIKVIRIENKKGINPCYPVNVGVRESDGDVILLSSPEIFHTCNIFDISNSFSDITDNNYLQFSVFCTTESSINDSLLKPDMELKHKYDLINTIKYTFYTYLGCNGVSFNNNMGSWYTHSEIKNDCFNFLSACTRKTYYELGGFNEIFVNGTGYDDTDFRDRVLEYVNSDVVWYDDFVAIHIDHPSVSNDNNTNLSLYNNTRDQKYGKNDDWGRLC